MSFYQHPAVGSRFKISGIEFEICFIQSNSIRYSTVAGGKIQHFSVEKYRDLLDKKKLTLCEKSKEQETILPSQLTKKEVDIMNRKLKYVRGLYKYAKHPTSKKEAEPIILRVAKEINDLSPPSSVNASRWFKKYISSNQNPMSLVPKTKKSGNRYFHFDPIVENIIKTRIDTDYLTLQRISIKDLRIKIVADILSAFTDISEVRVPSEKTISRRVRNIDPYKRSKGRHGKYVAKKRFTSAGTGTIATRSLEVVEADGNILDVLVIDEETGEVMGRPYGTCLIDKHSRCIISFVITMIPFSSATLLKALKTAISGNNERFGGLFETMIVDNGSDYISHSVRNFCNNLGIIIEHGAPRDPNSKPHVERFFGTLNSQLVHNLPGTTFSNPRHKGDYKSEKFACYTLDNLNDIIEQWLDSTYHKTIHRGHGRAPEKLWFESTKDNPITIYPIDDLDKIARDVSQRNISKGRVTVYNLQWYSHALATLEEDCKNKGIAAKVDVYIDSLDLSKVFVKDPRDHSIFIQADAVFPKYAEGLSLYEHKIISANLKEKGKEDLSSYGEYYLEIAKWELFEKIGNHNKEYSKKRIARIKETNKQHQKVKVLLDEQKGKTILSHKSDHKPSEIYHPELFIPDVEVQPNKEPKQNKSDFYNFERF